MQREACVCDHGFERSDLCAEIIIITHLLRTGNSTQKKKDISCYMLETVQLNR